MITSRKEKPTHTGYSLLTGKAVNHDGEEKDEHEDSKNDTNQLLQLGQSAGVFAEEMAASPAVGGRAAANQTDREICKCIPGVSTNRHVI